jgi:hypothetical protein
MNGDYRELILSRQPVAYWRLGEAAGPTAVDETGNGHDGRYFGDPTFGQPGAIQGDDDTAVQFHGADWVEIPNSVHFSQPQSTVGLTVEAWMRPDFLTFPGESNPNSVENPYVHWLGKGDSGQDEWGLRFYCLEPNTDPSGRPNRISAYLWNLSNKEGAGAYVPDAVEVGVWIHIVGCYQPGDSNAPPLAGVQLYKNGEFRKGPPDSGTLYSNPKFLVMPAHGSAPVRLGTRDTKSFFLGALDEVAIYPRVLTPEEILENYQTGIGENSST